ncbi:MAG: PSD1 and planctomycete cytochrome C domain-containing protein [Roseibacillus sp.]|nr:PSD1 and planctomycete cytochrome C domain-containing protein [Roseibacillus sp.]
MSRSFLALQMLIAALWASGLSASVDFNRDIRPILSNHCFACHGPDEHERKGKLRLDTAAGALKGGETGDTIVAGKPDDSELIHRIFNADPDEVMPPPKAHKELGKEEKELIRQWIAEGGDYAEPWTYLPPRRHPLPPAGDRDWGKNWIDNFILTRLQSENLKPSPDTDPVTLVRRLHFDLIGLPPTPAEVDQFVKRWKEDPASCLDTTTDALLASPHFGERMAMYWLDLVRYADTCGYHGDQDHSISPYRDYVIDAFNDNLPFDQFTREQLAGDLLPNPTVDQKIATGYNRLLQTSHEGGVQAKEYLAIYFADRVRNLSNVWMGATVGCAQCHDHKYDPYTSRDFYALGAFFADVDESQHFRVGSNSLPTRRPPEIDVHTKRERQRIAELENLLATARFASEAARKKVETELTSLRKAKRKTMITVATKPRTIRILPRGDWLDDSGPVVEPAFPAFLTEKQNSKTKARLTRLDLANWLTDPGAGTGGLTARVMANRFWYLVFGSGLSKRLDDFGGQGEAPVHPELLDNLAVEFYESGWNVKHMMKLLVTSRTYRQSSLEPIALRERDPYNRLLARQSRYRLPAETIRDNALAISGLLQTGYGGASSKPYQPPGYYRHLNFPARRYAHHADGRQWRRGVYVHWQRQFLHPMLRAFDAPTREECTAERPRSNTPIAAMTLLNDPSFVEAARVFAERILREGGQEDRARLEFAYREALSRIPDEQEIKIMGRLFALATKEFRTDPAAARKLISTGQAPPPKGIDTIEHASWTTVARAILNLSETYSRN